jgi:hypothetical protein
LCDGNDDNDNDDNNDNNSQSLVYGSFTYLIGDIEIIGFVMAICGAADCAGNILMDYDFGNLTRLLISDQSQNFHSSSNLIGSLINGIISSKFGKRVVILVSSVSALIAFIASLVISQIKYPSDNFYVSLILFVIDFDHHS